MPEMIVLAGDMALRTGFAIGSTERGFLSSGIIDVQDIRKRISLARAMRTLASKLRDSVLAVQGLDRVDVCVYEEPAMHGKSSNKLPQYAMVSALLWSADTLGCTRIERYWPTSVKRRVAHSGKADKASMISAANRWISTQGREITDDNEADAVCLLKLTLHDLTRQPEKQVSAF